MVRAIPIRLVRGVRNHRIASVIVVFAMAAFVALAALAMASETTLLRFDQAVQHRILESRTDFWNRAMVGLTFLGTRYVIGGIAVALLAWSVITKRHRTLAFVMVAAVLFNPLFEIGFKELVDRVRPAADQLLPGNGPSFPSGHVLAAMGFYGLVPFVMYEVTRNTWLRFAGLVGSVLIVLSVTVSRPYLDVHWTTDAIGGVALGIVLVVATYHTFLWLDRRPGERSPTTRRA